MKASYARGWRSRAATTGSAIDPPAAPHEGMERQALAVTIAPRTARRLVARVIRPPPHEPPAGDLQCAAHGRDRLGHPRTALREKFPNRDPFRAFSRNNLDHPRMRPRPRPVGPHAPH